MNVLGIDNDSSTILGSNNAGIVMASIVQDRPNKLIAHEVNLDYENKGGSV